MTNQLELDQFNWNVKVAVLMEDEKSTYTNVLQCRWNCMSKANEVAMRQWQWMKQLYSKRATKPPMLRIVQRGGKQARRPIQLSDQVSTTAEYGMWNCSTNCHPTHLLMPRRGLSKSHHPQHDHTKFQKEEIETGEKKTKQSEGVSYCSFSRHSLVTIRVLFSALAHCDWLTCFGDSLPNQSKAKVPGRTSTNDDRIVDLARVSSISSSNCSSPSHWKSRLFFCRHFVRIISFLFLLLTCCWADASELSPVCNLLSRTILPTSKASSFSHFFLAFWIFFLFFFFWFFFQGEGCWSLVARRLVIIF